MSAIQIQRCAVRIRDPVVRDRFERMMRRADELALQASKLRLEAWRDFRRATGDPEPRRGKKPTVGQYA